MGVVQRQSLKQTIVTYAGILLGGLATLLIFPLNLRAYGLLEWLLNTALVIVPFVSLGTTGLAVRFYPEFKDDESRHNGLLGLLLSIVTLSCLLFATLAYIFYTPFSEFVVEIISGTNKYADAKYIPVLIIFVTLYSYQQLLSQYTSNFLRIVVPKILDYLLPKIFKPLLFLLFFIGALSVMEMIYGMALVMLLIVFGLVLYLYRLQQWSTRLNLKFLTGDRRKRLAVFAGYGTLGGTGHVLANRIDIVMVGALTSDMKLTGVYTVVTYLSEIIDAPRKAVNGITGPLAARAWQQDDHVEVERLYQKSSINLLIIGSAIFGAIWLSTDALFKIMPDTQTMMQGKYIVLILGAAKLVDMMTGINNLVIGYSKYFRFNFYAVLVLAIFNVVCNLLFIPPFGIHGAALATFASITGYNLIKFGYAWRVLHMQPFDWTTLKVLAIGLFCYAGAELIPTTENIFIDIPARSGGFVLLFGTLVFYLNLSEDLTSLAGKFFRNIKSKLLGR